MRTSRGMARYVAFVAFVVVGFAASVGRGGFVLVEDFDGLELGNIGGQNGWYASGSSATVVTLPGEGANQALKLTADPAVVHKGLVIESGSIRMLFLRFRFEGQHNYSFGLSHLALPDEFSDFGPELRKRAAFDDLSIHDGHTYVELATLVPATWYNLWGLVDNASGDTQVWLHARPGEGATAEDQLADTGGRTVFDFRTNTHGDLLKFYIKAASGGSGGDPLWIDDIYVENSDSPNLANPVPEPHLLVCVFSAAVVLACRRWSRREPRA